MNFRSHFSSRPELVDDHVTDTPDAPDRTVLSAVRTWLRPACESARGGVHRITSLHPAIRAGAPSIKTVENKGAEPAGM